MNILNKIILIAVLVLSGQSHANSELTLKLPTAVTSGEQGNIYVQSLLTEAFASLDIGIQFQFHDVAMNSARMAQSLRDNEHIDIAWLSAEHAKDPSLLAIEVAVYNNIHGNRLLLIRDGQQSEFDGITDLSQLAGLTGLQARNWSDYQVLTKNGLQINGSLSYPAMFKALRDGLADYFPRSVMTIQAGYKKQPVGLAIEQKLLLRYPNQFYFYVSPERPELAAMLAQGLANLQQSGRFEQLFNHHYAERVKGLNLATRRVLELAN